MTTSGEMTSIVADALILPTATVSSYYRVLREDGLVTKGGRGRSAAQMTAMDLARLLITVMGSDKLEDAPYVCRLLGTTVSVQGVTAKKSITPLYELMTLEEALVALLLQLKPRREKLPDDLPLLPFLGNISDQYVEFEICSTTLESRIIDGARSLEFWSTEKDRKIVHHDKWSSLSTKERLLQKAGAGGMITKRSIDRIALVRAGWCLL